MYVYLFTRETGFIPAPYVKKLSEAGLDTYE